LLQEETSQQDVSQEQNDDDHVSLSDQVNGAVQKESSDADIEEDKGAASIDEGDSQHDHEAEGEDDASPCAEDAGSDASHDRSEDAQDGAAMERKERSASAEIKGDDDKGEPDANAASLGSHEVWIACWCNGD
jgi:hypothetical protein